MVQGRDGEEGASVPLAKGAKPCLVAMISYVCQWLEGEHKH